MIPVMDAPAPAPSSPPDPRAGDRVLAVVAVAAGLLLALSAYSPRFSSTPSDYKPGASAAYRVDLNRADRDELMQVPGIGPGKADAIVARRNAMGGFTSPGDLDSVKGFGSKTLEKLGPHVVVNGSTVLPNAPPSLATGKFKAGDPPLDINSASEAELQRLPGIGPAMAARIVAARPFAAVEELRKVKGIGAKTFGALRPWVSVK
jgi:competence protein ComEA